MGKIYQVLHLLDVDGGFGDAISTSEVLYTFTRKEDADKFVERYNNPHVYDKPYAELWGGCLEIHEMDVIDSFDSLPELQWDKDAWIPRLIEKGGNGEPT